MSSQFPEIKNEMDKISVPTEKLDRIIETTVKENKRKKSKKKIAFYSASAAVVGFGLFISSAILSPTMAKVASHIPVVGTFFNDVDDEGLRIAGQKGLTQVVDQSSKDNGITLTINEIFYDGTRFTFGYTHESLFALGEIERPTIEVNGKEINFSSGYSGEFVTPQKFKGIIDITPAEELPVEFDLKMRIDAVGLIPGKWEFSFPVKQSNEVTVIKSQDVKIINDAEVHVDSLKIGPAGTDLSVKVNSKLGSPMLNMLQFYIIDEKGRVLDAVSGSGYGDTENGKEKMTFNYLYSPLKEGTKKLRIIPYTIPMNKDGFKEVVVKLNGQSLPIILDQGDFGKILITEIKYSKDKMIVNYEVQSDAIIDNHSSFNPFWVEDTNGKRLLSKDNPFPERIEGNRFKQEFGTEEKKGLQLKTFKYPKPIMYEEFELEIP